MSRSQRGMNHLGSGHVLSNNPTASRDEKDNSSISDI